MAMENKHKHMDYIQSAITRMASNSFYLKGWNITVVAAIVTVSMKESDWKIYAFALVLTIIFWFLDSYYLNQEKLLRKLYEKVSSETDDSAINFSMDTSPYKDKVPPVPGIMLCNISVTPLYLLISVVLLILIHFV